MAARCRSNFSPVSGVVTISAMLSSLFTLMVSIRPQERPWRIMAYRDDNHRLDLANFSQFEPLSKIWESV